MMAGIGDDDMDSLFEGMVLFNPSQIQEDPSPDNNHQEQDDRTDDSLQHCQDDLPATSTIVPLPSSQPLDENLFSDLTLVTSLPNSQGAEPEPELPLQSQSPQLSAGTNASVLAADAAGDSATTTTTTTARQSSRKKRRAGLRIGYGRDNVSDDLPHLPSPPVKHPIPISSDIGSETPDVLQNANSSSDVDALPSHHPEITTDAVVISPASESSHDNSKSDISSNQKEEEISPESETSHDSLSESQFRQIKARIDEKLNNARQLVASVSAVRKDSIRNRRQADENANLASVKYIELEKQLEEACEAEDFERAERVSQDLSAAEKEKQACTNSLREADALIDSVDFKMQQAFDSQIAAEEECAILLEQFATVSTKNQGRLEGCEILFTMLPLYHLSSSLLSKIDAQLSSSLLLQTKMLYTLSCMILKSARTLFISFGGM